jgi:hypothetical protein
MLGGLTTTPPPKPRPHRLDPVRHDAPSCVLRLSRAPGPHGSHQPDSSPVTLMPRWRSPAAALADDAGVAWGPHPPAQRVAATARLRATSSGRPCPTHRSAAVIHGQSRPVRLPLSWRISPSGAVRGCFPSSRRHEHPGPRWVRTASETAGPRWARAGHGRQVGIAGHEAVTAPTSHGETARRWVRIPPSRLWAPGAPCHLGSRLSYPRVVATPGHIPHLRRAATHPSS